VSENNKSYECPVVLVVVFLILLFVLGDPDIADALRFKVLDWSGINQLEEMGINENVHN